VSSEHKAPLVIFIHGGCWLNQYDVAHSHAFSTALAQAGYVVWAIEYRRVGDHGGGWPGSLKDVEKAIAYTAKLSEYPINLNQVAIAGHSAGGHLALLAGANSSLEQGIVIKAVVGLAPIVDLLEYAKGGNSCQTAVSKFMGGMPLQRSTQYSAANPVELGIPDSTILIHGSADVIVPIEQSINKGVALRTVEGAGHFDLIHPGTPAFQVLLRELARVLK
jgi:acetyl esterase/lipase